MTDFTDFSYIGNNTLRNWNQLNVVYNLNDMGRNNLSRRFAKKLSKKDKLGVMKLAERVNIHGYENVRREIIRNLNG